jgi:hypothetical protein
MPANTSPFPTKPEKRSPFPRKSLPQPGESLQDAAYDLVFQSFIASGSVAITVAGVAAYSWVMRWANIAVSPWLWTYGAVFMGALATWQYFRARPRLEALRLGIRGEREVGRMLEETRKLGYVVFHDLPGDGFNVDHALVGPGGVFAIETKTISKPRGRKAEVDYDGQRVLVDGHTPDRDPVAQAQGGAAHVREVLKRMTDRQVAVRPVVLFPSWMVNRRPGAWDVWVLNPKELFGYLRNEPTRLSREDIALYVDRLTRDLSGE